MTARVLHDLNVQDLLSKKAITSREQYEKHVPCPALEFDDQQAIAIWNEMGGEIDYAALPWLLERHGVLDTQALITRLMVIRTTLQSKGQ